MIDTPTISVIVPVYNAAKSLDRCVQSKLSQTYTQWELILVNDGSMDGSASLCDKYVASDARISVCHKANGGVSSARNQGLLQAKGDYVAFIDSDDYVEINYLEKLIKFVPADLIICGFKNIGGDSFLPEALDATSMNNKSLVKKIMAVPYYLDTPWCKLFKRDIISKHGLAFDQKLKLSEDTLFCYEFLSNATSVGVVPEMLYIYDGLWGGGSKYKLSFDELSYMSQRITGAMKDINKTFNTDVEIRYKGFHVSKLINLFSDYQDKQIYELYIKFYDNITIGDFLGGSNSPLTIGLSQAATYARKGNKNECLALLKQIKRFTTTPARQISFCSKKLKLSYCLLQFIGARLTGQLLTKLYIINSKNAKNSICQSSC